MSPDLRPVDLADDREVVAAVDHDERGPRLVIADITRDGAWLSMEESAAPTLENWR